MLRCKEGDIVMVVKPQLPENYGKVVQIVGPFNIYHLNIGYTWMVEFPRPVLCANGVLDTIAYAWDHQLMPLGPLPDKETGLTWAPIKQPVEA